MDYSESKGGGASGRQVYVPAHAKWRMDHVLALMLSCRKLGVVACSVWEFNFACPRAVQ